MTAKLRSEYWLTGEAHADNADGDIGDKNHMAHVCDYVGHLFLDALREHKYLRSLIPDLDWLEDAYDRPQLCEAINNWADGEHSAGRLTEEALENIYTWICEQIGWDEEKFRILIGTETEGDDDPRNYAIKHLGWIKVTKNTLACWVIDHSTCRKIEIGMDDVLASEGIDEPSEEILFDITTHSDGNLYEDVPLSLIEAADTATIIRRHRRGGSMNLTIQPGPEPIA